MHNKDKKMKNTNFAVVMSTYVRPDGQTEIHLEKALNSLLKQTHKDWKIFLIGDKFEDEKLFQKMISKIPEGKIKAVNRPFAPERDKYPPGSHKLWCSGGLSGVNYGIELALEEGYEYVCVLDHDDFWHEDHLKHFNTILEKNEDLVILAARSFYGNNNAILPQGSAVVGKGYIPQGQNVVKSSACIKWNAIESRFRDVFEETGQEVPSDLDFWNRLAEEMKAKGYKGYLSSYITCYHIEEHAVLRGEG